MPYGITRPEWINIFQNTIRHHLSDLQYWDTGFLLGCDMGCLCALRVWSVFYICHSLNMLYWNSTVLSYANHLASFMSLHSAEVKALWGADIISLSSVHLDLQDALLFIELNLDAWAYVQVDGVNSKYGLRYGLCIQPNPLLAQLFSFTHVFGFLITP